MSSQNVRLWVLGAGDPEMAVIETLLRAAGEKVAYATIAGVRVHPGNAYKAETLPEYPAGLNEVILVECGFTEPDQVCGLIFGETGGHGKVTVMDHHRPGDPGYGKPPEDFLAASSIGQVMVVLAPSAPAGKIPREWPMVVILGDAGEKKFLPHKNGGWCVVASVEAQIGFALPTEVILCAAADHCLESAYRGKCSGVDPDALMQWRAETRAAFQKRPVADVLRDVESARSILQKAILSIPGGTGGCSECNYSEGDCLECNYSGGQFPEFADLRGQQIPELPEAAAREGIAFLSTVKDKDGREKVVLQAAPAELVKKFLAGTLVKGLTDYYGDPARGFAGGYVK